MRHSRCCRGTVQLMGVITFLPFLPQQYILAEHIRPRNAPPPPPHRHPTATNTCAGKLRSVLGTAHTLQRLITERTSNVERRPIKASAPQTALKKLPQSFQWSQIISPASAIPLWKQSTGRLCLVATCGAATRIIPLHSRAGPRQEMRLFKKNRGS